MMSKTQENRKLKCDTCGKDTARVQHITRSYGKGTGILVIENVPVINCSSCGESYLDAETQHEIERIKNNRKKLAVRRPLAVAEYA